MFEYSFRPGTTSASDGFRAAFRYPDTSKTDGLPYHLDPAHMLILERLPKGSSILEIGCGGGQMRHLATSLGHSYLGTDISATRVHDYLQKHGGPDIICDAHELPTDDKSADVIYSAAVFEHLACPGLVAKHISRCLKPGGYFLGSVSFLEPWHDDSFYHMTPLGVYQMLIDAGLTPEYIWPGRKWSGYRAMMKMGNKGTQLLSFINIGGAIYKASETLRRAIKKDDGIASDARVAGAINWIARKP